MKTEFPQEYKKVVESFDNVVWYLKITEKGVSEELVTDDYQQTIPLCQSYLQGPYLEKESKTIKDFKDWLMNK